MKKTGSRQLNCTNLRHCLVFVLFAAFLANAQAQSSDFISPIITKEIARKPANYVPNDDVIVAPIYYNDNVFTKMKEDESTHIKRTRTQIRNWREREQFEKDWGLERRGLYNYPDQDERLEFFKRSYFRYLTKRAERSVRDDVVSSAKGTWRNWTTRDEVETIRANQESSDFIAENKSSKLGKNLAVNKSVKISKKKKLKFSFQPRLDQGLTKIGLKGHQFGGYFRATAWIGINNTQELRIEQTYNEIGFSLLTNYYVHKNELLVSVNQRLIPHVSAHYTYREEVGGESLDELSNKATDSIVEVRFGMTF